MSEEKSKLIPFSKQLEAAVEADAKRCHRSFVRQVVAVLTAYYQIDDVEIKQKQLAFVGELLPKSKKKIPVIETENKRKRKA